MNGLPNAAAGSCDVRRRPTCGTAGNIAETTIALTRHYTPKELAELWAVDESTIRRLFQDAPGVLRIGKAGRRDGKRDYVSLRIPESVAIRVHAERSRV
jgi:hypothetical protein